MDFGLKIGLVPERRDVANAKTRTGAFRASSAIENKERILKYIKANFTDELTEFVDLEWLNDEGLLYDNSDVDRVKDEFVRQGVDAIFIINCNFGNEEAAGQLAYKLQLPVLLWGPQDMDFPEDGTRYTDAQCGLFAISNQLRRLRVPFSYIENCPVEAETFAEGLKKFLSVACMVKTFKSLKITQVGTRLNAFKSVMANELELTERFGINISTVNLIAFEQKVNRILEEKTKQLKADVEAIKGKINTDGNDDAALTKMLALVYAYKEVFAETRADVVAAECWSALPLAFGVTPCLAMSLLADEGYMVVCESDLCGAITQAILAAATRGKGKPLFGEFTVRNPINKNSELLWHCGPFPYSMKKEGETASLPGGRLAFRAKDGEYTLARFQGDKGSYTLLGGGFKTTEGPKTGGTYLWGEFDNWPRLERKLIDGPYIHHMSELYGDYTDVLREFCKYTDGLSFDSIDD